MACPADGTKQLDQGTGTEKTFVPDQAFASDWQLRMRLTCTAAIHSSIASGMRALVRGTRTAYFFSLCARHLTPLDSRHIRLYFGRLRGYIAVGGLNHLLEVGVELVK
jgi:hypothetical protein